MSSLITGMNDRVGILGLGSGEKFDTQKLLNMELQVMEMRKEPYVRQSKELESEKSAWKTFSNSLNNFNSLASKVGEYSESDKKVIYGEENYFDVKAKSNSIEGSYDLEVRSIARSQRVMGDQLSTGELGLSGVGLLNGKELEITEEMTTRDIAKSINEGDYGATAVVLDGKLVLTSEKTGIQNEMTFDDSQIFQDLGLTTSEGQPKNVLQNASDANYVLNGVEMTSESNQIKEVEGLEIQLQKVTDGPVSFGVEQSLEALKEDIQELVEGFNSLIGAIEDLSGEDSILEGKMAMRSIKSELNGLVSSFYGDGVLTQYGISFDEDASGGRIQFDEQVFDEKYESNPLLATEVITGEDGFAGRLNALIENYTKDKGILSSETEAIDGKVERIDDNIRKMDDSFERQKEHLIFKYAQLEVMMKQLESQKEYFETMFGNDK